MANGATAPARDMSPDRATEGLGRRRNAGCRGRRQSWRPEEPSGVPDLDTLCSGGLLRDSITLVAGPTGTGKTLLAVEFLASAAARGERALLLGYEESGEQIGRNAVGAGRAFDRLREQGALKVVSVYPEEASLEDHLLEIKHLVDSYAPSRLVVDSLTALERAGGVQADREFVIALTSYAKQRSAHDRGVRELTISAAAR